MPLPTIRPPNKIYPPYKVGPSFGFWGLFLESTWQRVKENLLTEIQVGIEQFHGFIRRHSIIPSNICFTILHRVILFTLQLAGYLA